MIKRSQFLMLMLALWMSGCNFFAPPAAEQTLVADHSGTATQMADLRTTATAETDRLSLTLEFAQTAVRAVDLQSTGIAATIIATGVLIDLRAITPEIMTPQPTQQPGRNSPPPILAITPVISNQGGAQGNSTLENPPQTTPVPDAAETADPDAPSLTNIVLTTGVGADDCALGATTVFSTDAGGVYISAVANNLNLSNRVVSRWLREGVEVVQYEWTPSFDIASACIWFYMPADSVDFSPGNWSVQLELDGVPIGTAAAFTVSGSGDQTGVDTGVEQLPTESG